MTYLKITPLIILDPSAPNSKMGEDTIKENIKMLKNYYLNRNENILISGAAIKRWIIDTARYSFQEFRLSQRIKDKNVNAVYVEADPVSNHQDDICGYFSAKKEKSKNKDKDSEQTQVKSRKSPLQVSNGVFLDKCKHTDSRTNAQHEGNTVLYNIELTSGALRFTACLDLGSLSVFYYKDLSGYQNININKDKEIVKKALENGATLYEDKKALALSYEEKIKRVEIPLRSTVNLIGGANMSTNYTEVSPSIFILYVGKLGSTKMKGVYRFSKKYNCYIIDPKTLYEIYLDNRSHEIISKIYVGWDAGYPYDPHLNSLHIRDEVFSQLIELFGEENICVGPPNKVLDQFIKDLDANKEDWLKPKLS